MVINSDSRRFGRTLESKPSDLEERWSPNLQIWKNVGVQTFRFGRTLESKPSDLEERWSPNLQIWKNVGVQTFRFGRTLESKPSDLEERWSPNLCKIGDRPHLIFLFPNKSDVFERDKEYILFKNQVRF